MSHHKVTITQFRSFVRAYGISQHGAALTLGCSQPTLSKMLSGHSETISNDKLTTMTSAMQRWMDEYHAKENELYLKLIPICRDANARILVNVFKDVLLDIRG